MFTKGCVSISQLCSLIVVVRNFLKLLGVKINESSSSFLKLPHAELIYVINMCTQYNSLGSVHDNDLQRTQQQSEMKCDCIKSEGVGYRQRFQENPRKKAHLAVKVVTSLGLKQYILNKFVFRCKQSTYKIEDNKLFDLSGQPISYSFPHHSLHAEILSSTKHNISISVPMVHLKHQTSAPCITIIYSHGNCSDLIDSLRFFQYILAKSERENIKINVIVYDYTGYGCSQLSQISQQTVIRDLQAVVDWVKGPKSSILLWGFSLGSFPTVQVAALKKVGGTILHAPLASGASFFDDFSESMINDSHLPYDVDCLSNLQAITQIQCPILLLHSSADQIIPISHSLKLYQCLKLSKKNKNFSLVEMDELLHNQIHSFLIDMNNNSVNVFVWNFISRIHHLSGKIESIWNCDLPTEQDGNEISLEMGSKSSNMHSQYFQMS